MFVSILASAKYRSGHVIGIINRVRLFHLIGWCCTCAWPYRRAAASVAAERSRRRRLVARLLARLVDDGRVGVAVGGQGVGTGQGRVQIIAKARLNGALQRRCLLINLAANWFPSRAGRKDAVRQSPSAATEAVSRVLKHAAAGAISGGVPVWLRQRLPQDSLSLKILYPECTLPAGFRKVTPENRQTGTALTTTAMMGTPVAASLRRAHSISG